MSNNFLRAYQEIEMSVLNDKELVGEIELIALLGSAADKEESNEWSDLDVLVVLKSDGQGNMSMKSLDRLKQISAEVSTRYSFPVSILSHTMDDFKNYVSFEYLKHYLLGDCSYPNSDYLKDKIEGILKKRKVNEHSRKAYCAYHMRHIRFNLLRKYVSMNGSNSVNYIKEFVKLLIDKMIKTTDLALNFRDIWPESKQEILHIAKKDLNIDVEPLSVALDIRKRWANVSEKELREFILIGLEYISRTINLVLGEYKDATPEERMSA